MSYGPRGDSPLKLVTLTHFVMHINAAIDTAMETGRHQDISVAAVEQHIAAGDLIQWLAAELGDDVDLGYFTVAPDQGRLCTAHSIKSWRHFALPTGDPAAPRGSGR